MKLGDRGRIVADRVTLERFGEALQFVGGALVVAAFDTAKRRVVLFVYECDATDTWKKTRELEVPLACPTRPSFSASTSVHLVPWGPKRARVFARHTVSSLAKGGAREESTWAGELALPASTLTAVANEEPKARFEDTCVFGTKRGLRVVAGKRELLLDDPDADKVSRFGEGAVLIDASSIWVCATGTYAQKFAPRIHEFDHKSGKLRRTVKFGKRALPGVGFGAVFWNDGVLLSSGQAAQVVFVPRSGGAAPTVSTDANWESESYGMMSGQTAVAVVGERAFVGAPFGSGGAGCLELFRAGGERSLEVRGSTEGDGVGASLATDGARWLAVGAPYARSGAVHLLRVEGAHIAPANVAAGAPQNKADAFEAAYPGFLTSPEAPTSNFAAWQLKAAVYSCLMAERHVPPLDLRTFAGLHPKKKLDPEGSKLVREAVRYLRFWPEQKKVVEKLASLTFDGGNALYQELYPFWDGEDGTFDAASLEGIAVCRGLEHVDLSANGKRPSLEPLLALPKLKKLRVPRGKRAPKDEKVLAKLRAKGVTVRED